MSRRTSFNVQHKGVWLDVDIRFVGDYPEITNVLHADEEITDLLSDKALDTLTGIVKAEIEENKRYHAEASLMNCNPLDKFPSIWSNK